MQMTASSFGIQLLLLEIHPDDFRDAHAGAGLRLEG
jgi:hypothetical protein